MGLGCAPTDHYPRRTKVVMYPLPKKLQDAAEPVCEGAEESVV